MISNRAKVFVQSPSSLVVAHFTCEADPYDAKTNPEGYLNFGTADNHLLWDLVGARLAQSAALRERDVHYGLLYGTAEFRSAVAAFLAKSSGAPVSADNLVAAAGASAALDMLAYSLCEPGDGIIVPAPYYSGFHVDLSSRAQARIVPAPLDPADGFTLNVAALQRALDGARGEGIRVKAVLITSPHNPLGITHDARTLRDVVAFAKREGLHAIFDEIYMNTVFGPREHTSALAFREDAPDRVHVVWGFAKDFGLSGFKVGILHTENPEVLAACREMSYLSPASTLTQTTLTHMLEDAEWVKRLQRENRARVRASYEALVRALGAHGIAHRSADAGVFAWLDLREWLEAPTFDAEARLHEKIFTQARVNVTPGRVFGSPEPGWFRLCYAQHERLVPLGVERLARVLAR